MISNAGPPSRKLCVGLYANVDLYMRANSRQSCVISASALFGESFALSIVLELVVGSSPAEMSGTSTKLSSLAVAKEANDVEDEVKPGSFGLWSSRPPSNAAAVGALVVLSEAADVPMSALLRKRRKVEAVSLPSSG